MKKIKILGKGEKTRIINNILDGELNWFKIAQMNKVEHNVVREVWMEYLAAIGKL